MNLLVHPEAKGADSGKTAVQMECFFLVNIPDGWLLVSENLDQLTAFSGITFKKFDVISIPVQGKNGHDQGVGSGFSEIEEGKADHTLPFPVKSDAFLIAGSDISGMEIIKAC